MRISVGLPLYDGKMDYRVASCLLTEIAIAAQTGDTLSVSVLAGCSDLARGRNQIVHEFLESDADRLVFLDSDVTFEPGKLLKIAHYPEDIVGGAYRLKGPGPETYPIAFLSDRKELWANEHGLLEVQMVPTGFLSMSRDAFKRFRDAYPGREYQSRGITQYCYFQIPFRDGALYTEDAYFCREWREMGGQLFMDPELTLTHWHGNIPYEGHIGNWLKRNAGILPAESKEISDGVQKEGPGASSEATAGLVSDCGKGTGTERAEAARV